MSPPREHPSGGPPKPSASDPAPASLPLHGPRRDRYGKMSNGTCPMSDWSPITSGSPNAVSAVNHVYVPSGSPPGITALRIGPLNGTGTSDAAGAIPGTNPAPVSEKNCPVGVWITTNAVTGPGAVPGVSVALTVSVCPGCRLLLLSASVSFGSTAAGGALQLRPKNARYSRFRSGCVAGVVAS